MATAFAEQSWYDAQSSDRFENLNEAATAFCLYELAYHLGRDDMGDAGFDAFTDALVNDGYKDDEDEAREYCKRAFPSVKVWLAELTDDANRAAREDRRFSGVYAVVRFIRSVMA